MSPCSFAAAGKLVSMCLFTVLPPTSQACGPPLRRMDRVYQCIYEIHTSYIHTHKYRYICIYIYINVYIYIYIFTNIETNIRM